ncbi:MAG: squalene--hopene cyclase [Thermoguttaceae bacterium]
MADLESSSAAIVAAEGWLVDRQHDGGYWVGVLESNSCMEAEWLLAMHFLGIPNDPKQDRVVRGIWRAQRPDGSWEVYRNAPAGDINTTVECYAAMRAVGHAADDPRLVRARQWIGEHGGLSAVRVFTRYWLALIGEWPWDATPALPPELVALPAWFPVSIYRFAAWARATLVPLCVLSARRPVRPLPPEARLDELFPNGRRRFDFSIAPRNKLVSWESVFVAIDRALKLYMRLPVQPGREASVRLAVEWILKHQDADGAWGGIQPPWIYALMAMHVEGYPLTHPAVAKGLDAFNAHWAVERDGALYLQASESPVWDTIWAVLAMVESGHAERNAAAIDRGVAWLLGQQSTTPGDWAVHTRPNTPCGGWAFQRANVAYPDVDDTAVAMLTLAKIKRCATNRPSLDAALRRATDWVLAMQCSNGGWASFDRNNTSRLVTKIPFCDFGEVIDPPSVDVTAHVVEALAYLDFTAQDVRVRRAVRFILKEQESDGSWFGRWGVNHIYGTAAVLPALTAVNVRGPFLDRAADWLTAHQNADGGWGETPVSYADDRMRGVGESTPSQTAWALMGLLAMESARYDAAIDRGVAFLVDRQSEGTWQEPQYTGTGFPGYGVGERATRSNGRLAMLDQGAELSRGFMLNYNLYRHYFPLLALIRAGKRPERSEPSDVEFIVRATKTADLQTT